MWSHPVVCETWAHVIFRAMNCLINLKIFTYLDFKRVGPLLFASFVGFVNLLVVLIC